MVLRVGWTRLEFEFGSFKLPTCACLVPYGLTAIAIRSIVPETNTLKPWPRTRPMPLTSLAVASLASCSFYTLYPTSRKCTENRVTRSVRPLLALEPNSLIHLDIPLDLCERRLQTTRVRRHLEPERVRSCCCPKATGSSEPERVRNIERDGSVHG